MLSLDLDLDFEEQVIGLVSKEMDYRLVFLLNRVLDLNFSKSEKDQGIHKKEKGEWVIHEFAWYEYRSNRLKCDFKLFCNYNDQGNYLIPEWKKYPFLLVYTPILEAHETEIMEGLKSLNEIKFTNKLDPSLSSNVSNLYIVKEVENDK